MILSKEAIEIVKATVPILRESGVTLTRHFYKRMFRENPEVIPYFNPANQQNTTQQTALAAAICAYAANIDNLDRLGPAVELIANKHASLQIQPEHYPIVGQNLLASIKEVLGDAATNDVLEAWNEAYQLLAQILIDRESQIYDEQTQRPHGWSGFKEFVVTKKVRESDVICSFYLAPKDDSPLPSFKPGQYITIRMGTADGRTTMRNYSLSDQPNPNHFRISVKREAEADARPEGLISNRLHSEIHPGDSIEVAPPCGDFYIDPCQPSTDRPLVLIAGGVGITPLMSMLLSQLENSKRDIVLVHACLDEGHQAFRETIDRLADQHSNLTIHYRYSQQPQREEQQDHFSHVSSGLVDADLIWSLVDDRRAEFYFCGPKPFMIQTNQILIDGGIAKEQIHFEFFGPQQELEDAIAVSS